MKIFSIQELMNELYTLPVGTYYLNTFNCKDNYEISKMCISSSEFTKYAIIEKTYVTHFPSDGQMMRYLKRLYFEQNNLEDYL